jgi:hypothetical protein
MAFASPHPVVMFSPAAGGGKPPILILYSANNLEFGFIFSFAILGLPYIAPYIPHGVFPRYYYPETAVPL